MASSRGGSLALVWLRSSLRLGDNEALSAAARSGAAHLVLYHALDPADLRARGDLPPALALVSGLPKLGPFQCA